MVALPLLLLACKSELYMAGLVDFSPISPTCMHVRVQACACVLAYTVEDSGRIRAEHSSAHFSGVSITAVRELASRGICTKVPDYEGSRQLLGKRNQ